MAQDVTLDFSQAQPVNASPVTLDFSKAQPLNSSVSLDFTKAQPLAPAPEPSAWDRIKSAADRYASGVGSFLEAAATGKGGGEAVPDSAMPALATAKKYAVDPFNRAEQATANFGRQVGREVVTGGTLLQHGGDYLNATLPSPYGPKPSVESPEQLAEREHHAALGIAGGLGEIVGGTVGDPRNWPFLTSSAARPALKKLISRGFTAQMAPQTYEGAKYLYDNWDRLTPEQRWETGTKTAVGALFTAAGLKESVGKAETPTRVQEIPTRADSPLGQVLEEPAQAPHVRVVNSSAAARDLLERDTILRPVAEVPSNIHDPALQAVEAQTRGRAAEVAKKYPVTPVPDAQARTTGPTDIAAFRLPRARVVSDSYVPVVSSDEVLAESVNKIIDNSTELLRAGVDPSAIRTHEDIDAALQIASDHIKPNLDPRAYATITLDGQRQLAADLGMSAEDVIAKGQGRAYNAEQLVAARSILKASSDYIIKAAKAAAASGDNAEFTRALSTHQLLQEKFAAARAEAGRALGSFRIGNQDLPQTKIVDILSKLPDKVKDQAARMISRVDPADPQSVRALNQMVAKVTPHTNLEKLFEAYQSAWLLSSPHTLIVKSSSEIAMAAMETMKKAVASGISGDRYLAESWYYARGMVQALAEHAKPILSGEWKLEGSPGFEIPNKQAIKGTLGSVVRVPTEAMSRASNLVYASNFYGELQSLAARQALSENLKGEEFHARQEWLAHNPTAEMKEAAHKLAVTNTFQDRLTGAAAHAEGILNAKPTNVKWVPEYLKTVPPGRFLAPFFKTPYNLVRASITHVSPYELLNVLGDAIKGRDIDVDEAARGLVGSSIAAAIGSLVLSGHITGGGSVDFKKAETLRATGWQPYSIKIGDHYYSYRRLEPVGLAAGLIADIIHGMLHGDPETVSQNKASQAVRMIARNFDDFPFMSTMSSLFQAVHDPAGGRAQGFINREAGSLVPALVSNVAETLDPTVRRPTSAMQAIQARIPGLTSAAPARVNVAGQTIQRSPSSLGGANPFEWTTAKHDPVLDELSRLGIGTPDPPKHIKWRDKPTELTDAEQQAFAEAEGQELYRRASRLIGSSSWKRLSDDRKREEIAKIHREIDEDRPARLTRLRREAKTQLSGRSLPLPLPAP